MEQWCNMRENKTLVGYISSTASVVITFVLRILLQEPLPVYPWFSGFISFRIGLESAIKIPLTLIPIVAAVICAIMIFSSKKSKKQKIIAGIISAILIILSVLFIWVNY